MIPPGSMGIAPERRALGDDGRMLIIALNIAFLSFLKIFLTMADIDGRVLIG